MNDEELKELNIFKSRSIIKQEKIKEALEKIDELIQFCVKYNKSENRIKDLKEIKEILEK